MIAEGRTGRDL